MNTNLIKLAEKITIEIALMTIQGEADVMKHILSKYGEFGVELAEELCKDKLTGKG